MPPPSIAVIGAGPTGLSAALALKASGCAVRILERNPSTVTESRAVGVNRRSLLHLERVEAAEAIQQQAAVLRRARLFTEGAPLTVLNIPQPAKGPPTIVALPQSTTEAILAERLAAEGGEIEFETEAVAVTQTTEAAQIRAASPDGEIEITADFVLGADGSRSVARRSLGIDFEGHRYPGAWTLFDAVLDWPWPDSQAAVFLDHPGTALFIVTLGDGRHRVITNAENPDARAADVVTVGEVSWRNEFSLSERCVASFGEDRVWLAGDAAHVHSPVGGQGMNLGIDDAFDFADTVLRSDFEGYQRRRRAAANRVMTFADRGLRLLTTRNRAVAAMRNLGLRTLGGSGFLRRRLASRVLGADAR